jgi:hypothetical protein
MLRLKEDIPIGILDKYGFEEDPNNCEHPEDHYYWLNNWFNQITPEYRITVSTIDKHIEILSLGDAGLRNTKNIEVLYRMIKDNIIEEI